MKNRILLLAALFTFGMFAANAQSLTVSCDMTGAEPAYERPFSSAIDGTCGAGATTALSGSINPAIAVDFSVCADGNYNFEVVLGSLGDSFMSLYCDFDPANPLDNLVAANDDFNGLASGFTAVPLIGGNCYTMVITTFGGGDTGTFDVNVTGGTFDISTCDTDGGNAACTFAGDIVAGAAACPAPPAMCTPDQADFTGDFEQGAWTITTPGDGSVTPNPPTDITLTSIDDGNAGDVTVCITVTDDTTISFDWDYSSTDVSSSTFDPAGYSVNGIQTQLTTDGNPPPAVQTGNATVILAAGDTFCFYQSTTDGILGPGTTTFSNFAYCTIGGITLVPTMSEWGLFLFGLVMVTLGLVFVYNKQRQTAI